MLGECHRAECVISDTPMSRRGAILQGRSRRRGRNPPKESG
jgi:hypothetical protein